MKLRKTSKKMASLKDSSLHGEHRYEEEKSFGSGSNDDHPRSLGEVELKDKHTDSDDDTMMPLNQKKKKSFWSC